MKIYIPLKMMPWETLKLDHPLTFDVKLTAPLGKGCPGFLPVYNSVEALAADWGVGMEYFEMVTKDK